MAISFGVFTSLLTTETPSLSKSFSASRVPVVPTHASLRPVRLATFATMSNPATETKKRGPRGIMRPRPVSPEMQALVGESEIPRTQVLKKIWAYIKENNLQDPENKKVIICDEKLQKIFGGKDRVGFLEIAGLITPHFLK